MRAHQVIWAMYHGEWAESTIDHINGIRDDNRIVNLRLADGQINGRNRGISKANTSGCVGVYWCKQTDQWCAQIKADYMHKNLGRFHSFEEAVAARHAAEKLYGFHPNHGKRNAYDEVMMSRQVDIVFGG
jgi:hypothetical protein